MKLLFILLSVITFIELNAQSETVAPKKVCELVDLKKTGDNSIYDTAGIEVKPQYPEAGLESMYSFIRKNFVIPQEIIDTKKAKTLVAMFVVEKDGNLTDIKIIRDVGYGSAQEAIRVLKLMPKWLPGEQNGKKVRCLYSIPIRLNAN